MHHVMACVSTILFVVPCIAGMSQITPAEVPGYATLITFETDPLGNPVANGALAGSRWASVGVTFDSNDAIDGFFTLRSPPNVLSGEFSIAFQPIHATFAPAVSLVGAWGFDFTLEVFDQQNQSLGAITYTDGSPGVYGGAQEFGFLGFRSDVPIARAEFRRAFPTDQVFGFHIDDLVFVGVPETSTVLLVMVGACMIGARRVLAKFRSA